MVGRELVLYLARSLLEQHGHDTAVTTLLDNTEIHIVPRYLLYLEKTAKKDLPIKDRFVIHPLFSA